MDTAIHIIAEQDKTAVSRIQTLRDGGYVFIKVVSNDGNGKYTVSLGGQSFQASARFPLERGSVLRVQVKFCDGKVILVPDEKTGLVLRNDGVFRLDVAGLREGILPEHFAGIFSGFGLPFDEVSVRLLSFLQQMGERPDAARLLKCRRIAARFSGREKIAAEAALFLAQKGVEPNEDNVSALLSLLLSDSTDSSAFHGMNDDVGGGDSLEYDDSSCDEDIFCELGKLYGKNLAALSNRRGLLTLLNHISTSAMHWIVLPFQYGGDSDVFHVVGNIRVLVNLDEKKTEKIVLSAQSQSRRYCFMLYYKRNNVSEIVFHIEPDVPVDELEDCAAVVRKFFPGVLVRYDLSPDDGVFLGSQELCLSSVHTEV